MTMMHCSLAVNEWQSQWQIDMRYTDAGVDDLIRDMADLHVDVKLRAIVTCARATEFKQPPTGQTFTHPFDGPLFRTTPVSQYQKGKTNLDFTEARDSEWQWHQLGQM